VQLQFHPQPGGRVAVKRKVTHGFEGARRGEGNTDGWEVTGSRRVWPLNTRKRRKEVRELVQEGGQRKEQWTIWEKRKEKKMSCTGPCRGVKDRLIEGSRLAASVTPSHRGKKLGSAQASPSNGQRKKKSCQGLQGIGGERGGERGWHESLQKKNGRRNLSGTEAGTEWKQAGAVPSSLSVGKNTASAEKVGPGSPSSRSKRNQLLSREERT